MGNNTSEIGAADMERHTTLTDWYRLTRTIHDFLGERREWQSRCSRYLICWSETGQRFNAYFKPWDNGDVLIPERLKDWPSLKKAKAACERHARERRRSER